jgi:tRNA(Ile)-lysidine synthase
LFRTTIENMQTNPVIAKVVRALREARLAEQGMVVALSGGPDSVALTRAIVQVGMETTERPLVLAHLNHQLRGAESDRDEDFIRELHAQLVRASARPKLKIERLDIGTMARSEYCNLEAFARRARYQWLAEVAVAEGLHFVVTGHTASDQAETVLHHLFRGTGLAGMRGIAPRRRLTSDVELLRPMLRVERVEILAYLQMLGQSYRDDSSNLDRNRTRNRIRHELLPFLTEHYNSRIASTLGRLAEEARSAYRQETRIAERILVEAELPRAGGMVVLDRTLLAAHSRNELRAVFRLVWGREQWPQGRMGFTEWDRAASLALGETKATTLPGRISMRVCGRVVQLARGS